jgi:transcriptional regulator with XRE-family HTH domain
LDKQPPISGRRIAGHRDRLGIKQKQLADFLGIGLSTLQGIERNRNSPGLLVLIGLTEILTENRLDLLVHGGLDDEGEYRSARFWKPEGVGYSPSGAVVDLRQQEPGMPVHLQRSRDEVRPTVPTLRSPLRTDRSRRA